MSNLITDCRTAFTPDELRAAQERAFFPFDAYGLAFTTSVTTQRVAYAGVAAATAPLVLKLFHVDPKDPQAAAAAAESGTQTIALDTFYPELSATIDALAKHDAIIEILVTTRLSLTILVTHRFKFSMPNLCSRWALFERVIFPHPRL